MLKNKRTLLFIIFAIALFLIPGICNAAEITATETTTTSTGKTVKWSYELEGDSIVNLNCINKSAVSGTVNIPSTIDGYTVTGFEDSYGNGIFAKCEGLTGVTIPNTINKIGDYAFYKCSSLINVSLPNGLINIGNDAFYDTRITAITMPDTVIKIGSNAFRGCSSLNNVVLNEGLINIGNYAFEGTRITNITIPNSVTSLGNGVFENCNALTTVILSNELTVINERLFANCNGLTSIVIPNKVTTICSGGLSWEGAFYNCKGLTKILIPDSVVTIEDRVFEDCKDLTIYGNDGQASKKYAEENNINFNYIANWNKEQSDITPPLLKSLEVDFSSAFEYDKGTRHYLASVGTNISIKAAFEEIIFGETTPILTIRCGNGDNITLNNGVISGSNIVYTYTIEEQDKGIITAVSMMGGDIKDEVGNKVEEYVCPELVTKIIGNHYVYANGKGSVSTDEGNNQTPSTTVTLSSIAITKTPTRNTYSEGEKFDKNGMVITATYSDGTTKEITNYSINLTEELKTTDEKVIITYTENNVTKTVEQKITVTPKVNSTITLTSIVITKEPTKKKYTEGEKFDKTGMVVTAKYSDGTTKKVTGYTVSPSAKLKTTDEIVIITYTEDGVTKKVEQTISVAKDTTTKGDNKLPQTGAALLSLVLVSLIAVAVTSKVKYGKYKDI